MSSSTLLIPAPQDQYIILDNKQEDTIQRLDTVIKSLQGVLENTAEYKKLGADLIKFKNALIVDYEQAFKEKDQPTQDVIQQFINHLNDLQSALKSKEKLHNVSEVLARMISITRQDATCGSRCFQGTMVSICGLTGTIVGLGVGALGGALAMGIAMSLVCIGYGCCCAMCGNGSCCTGIIFCFTENLPIALGCISISGLIGSMPGAFAGAVGGAYLGDYLSDNCYRKEQHTYQTIENSRKNFYKFYSQCQSVIFKKPLTEPENIEEKQRYLCGNIVQI